MDQNQKERIELPKRLVRLSVGQIVTHAHFAHDRRGKKNFPGMLNYQDVTQI